MKAAGVDSARDWTWTEKRLQWGALASGAEFPVLEGARGKTSEDGFFVCLALLGMPPLSLRKMGGLESALRGRPAVVVGFGRSKGFVLFADLRFTRQVSGSDAASPAASSRFTRLCCKAAVNVKRDRVF